MVGAAAGGPSITTLPPSRAIWPPAASRSRTSLRRAIVDLILTHENACPLIQVLSERGIPIVISTGADIDLGHPALSKAVAFLQKPYNDSELIEALVEWGR
jgi:FixJ family two-component response regulator